MPVSVMKRLRDEVKYPDDYPSTKPVEKTDPYYFQYLADLHKGPKNIPNVASSPYRPKTKGRHCSGSFPYVYDGD